MKLNAIVKVNEEVAQYTVSPAGRGVYVARLCPGSDRSKSSFPEEIVLVRGIRHWTGSCEESHLIRELGEVIDAMGEDAPIFKREGDSERKRHGSGSPETEPAP